ncbi:ATP-binding protein [Hellea balneolensis]|uniref:ATP-binding protein n=1 Tax=Hellea balneolensis TaxID=287478 RepID=UPI00040CDD5B|nr:ATP-binding protein [Hellea balneolensis]
MTNTETTMPTKSADITPNAAKLYSSLRQLDYTSTTAICDLVDNSIDAGASSIHVDVFAEGKTNICQIQVADNGSGMSGPKLAESMKLGSASEKDHDHHMYLGRYGMGMITAPLSIGRELTVESLQNETIHQAILDYEAVLESNKFVIPLKVIRGTNAKEFLDDFHNAFPDAESGTIVTIDKVDRWAWTRLSASEDNLVKVLGQTFRKFIQGGNEARVKIYVNGELIVPIDPIFDHNPQLLDEETFEVHGEEVTMRLFELEDYGRTGNRDRQLNIPNQGFYVLRNNREIAAGVHLKLFAKHNDYNRFRAEFSYPGSLDEFFNSGFTKQRIEAIGDQSLSDKIKKFLNPQLNSLKKKAKLKRRKNRADVGHFSKAGKNIEKRGNLITWPPSESDATVKAKAVRFETENNSDFAPLYDCTVDGKTVVIIWNEDHPFYQQVISAYSDDPDIVHPICYYIFALANAELKSEPDSQKQIILANNRSETSLDLRTLMHSS